MLVYVLKIQKQIDEFSYENNSSKLFGNVDYKSCMDESYCCMSFVHLIFFNTDYSPKYLLLNHYILEVGKVPIIVKEI